jgi:sugar phosphate isomerase/epimerase
MQSGVSTHIHVFRRLGRDLLADIKTAGFETVELYSNPPHWPDYDNPQSRREIADACLELGLVVNSVHAPFFRRWEDAKAGRWLSLTSRDAGVRREAVARAAESIAVAEFVQVHCSVLHLGASEEKEDGGTFERLFYSLEELLPLAVGLDVKLALENITNSFSRGCRIAAFIRDTGLEGVGCCYDCGHAAIYERLVEEFREMKPHLLTTHIHDLTDKRDNHLPLFEGEIDWQALAAEIAASDYEGALIVESKDVTGSPESLAAAFRAATRLREMIEEAGSGEDEAE